MSTTSLLVWVGCATCQIPPDSNLGQAQSGAVLFMLGVLGTMLVGVGGVFWSMFRRASKYSAETDPLSVPAPTL
jgi:hypothetical protein